MIIVRPRRTCARESSSVSFASLLPFLSLSSHFRRSSRSLSLSLALSLLTVSANILQRDWRFRFVSQQASQPASRRSDCLAPPPASSFLAPEEPAELSPGGRALAVWLRLARGPGRCWRRRERDNSNRAQSAARMGESLRRSGNTFARPLLPARAAHLWAAAAAASALWRFCSRNLLAFKARARSRPPRARGRAHANEMEMGRQFPLGPRGEDKRSEKENNNIRPRASRPARILAFSLLQQNPRSLSHTSPHRLGLCLVGSLLPGQKYAFFALGRRSATSEQIPPGFVSSPLLCARRY